MKAEGNYLEASKEDEDDFLQRLSGLVMVSISLHRSGGNISRGYLARATK
jgi:hypothetical protein